MKAIVRILATATCLMAGSAYAGEDVAGAKDHPLLTRYPDSFITEYTKNYDATEFHLAPAARSPRSGRSRATPRHCATSTRTPRSSPARCN